MFFKVAGATFVGVNWRHSQSRVQPVIVDASLIQSLLTNVFKFPYYYMRLLSYRHMKGTKFMSSTMPLCLHPPQQALTNTKAFSRRQFDGTSCRKQQASRSPKIFCMLRRHQFFLRLFHYRFCCLIVHDTLHICRIHNSLKAPRCLFLDSCRMGG